jgi:diketogulonate reductase-like aldo/keto reductase
LASNTNYEAAQKFINLSDKTSSVGHSSQFLLHRLYGGKSSQLASRKALKDAITDGEVKMGGVSNDGVKHLEELLAAKPRGKTAVNQYVWRSCNDAVTTSRPLVSLADTELAFFGDTDPIVPNRYSHYYRSCG